MRFKANWKSKVTQEIFDFFIVPFTQYKPREQDPSAFVDDTLFSFSRVSIRQYRVEEPFKMPGLFWDAPLLKIRYYGKRDITPNDHLWVRIDHKFPDKYDVEVIFDGDKDGDKDQVFTLTEKEFKSIRKYLHAYVWRWVDVGGPTDNKT